MARKAAVRSDGIRLPDLMSVMALARLFPLDTVKSILSETGKMRKRERNLPAYVIVYFVISLCFYRQDSYQEALRCIFETFNWVEKGSKRILISCKAAISQARSRLGSESLKRLYAQWVPPIAKSKTTGAFWRGWRLVSLDGIMLEIGDTRANVDEFSRPGVNSGEGSAYPQLRL
jgi:hypothetical protein